MSKLSFRARALDAAKPLPVYRDRDLPDRTDCVSISRAVPQMPTGMEKEEELEHHLQRVMSAQQVFRERKENMVIPVPEAQTNTTYYDRLYRGEVRVPKQLIHIQPLGLDPDQPDYDMDSEDETLLNRLNRKMEIKPLQFETMLDRLEKASTHQVVPLSEAKLLLNEDDYLLRSVYDYWLRKRRSCRAPSLVPHIRLEKRDGSTNGDAYVAFRRRTERMQTRKNRKSDEASYEKMLRLRRELSRTVTILEMIKRREKSKRELLHLTLEVVERRYQMGDLGGDAFRDMSLPLVEKPAFNSAVTLNNNNRLKTDFRTKMRKRLLSVKDKPSFVLSLPRKAVRRVGLSPQRRPGRPPGPFTVCQADIKQYDFHSSEDEDGPPPPLCPPSSPDEENHPDGVFVFRRKTGCQYLSPGAQQMGGVNRLESQRHFLTELTLPPHWTGVSRRRIGRGGRFLLDRASLSLDPVLKQLDPLSHPVCRTWTSTWTWTHPPSDLVIRDQKVPPPSGTSCPSLTEVLNSIQALRRFYYRPRPVQCQREGGRRPPGSSVEDSSRTCRLSHDYDSGSGGFTEEQYHRHQQQLLQMLQSNRSTRRGRAAQSLRSSESSWRTLDSASAQFAASAVISAAPGLIDREGRSSKTRVQHPSGSDCGSLPPPPRSLPSQRGQVGSIAPPHTAQPSTPPLSALKLASIAASLDRVPKVSTARDAHEAERRVNGLSETVLPMEVT